MAKVIRTLFQLIVFSLMIGCRASEFYTQKELRAQKVPVGLQGKTWTLRKISGHKEPTKTIAVDFQNNHDCTFDFQFAQQGDLVMKFKQHQLHGTYLIEGDKFRYINCGWREKIVWTTNPECKVTPTELAYIFVGEFQFEIDGEKLTLKNSAGDRFELLTGS